VIGVEGWRRDPQLRRQANRTHLARCAQSKAAAGLNATARRKLRQLDSAERLDELRIPRGNRLEQLKGFTPLRQSIRINDQWRITFRRSDGGADDVRIEDYYRG